jgi:hypothetical protein
LPNLPEQYNAFITAPSVSELSRKLNLAFSFSALESTMEFPNMHGDHMVAIQGKIFHRIRPNHQQSPIKWILYDGFEAHSNPRTQHTEDIPLFWIRSLSAALRETNPFVRQLINLSQIPGIIPDLRLELSEQGAADEIAALIRYDNTAINEVAPRTLEIFRYHDNRRQKIYATSRLWEPLTYPLLFPHGTKGWGVSRCMYIFMRMCLQFLLDLAINEERTTDTLMWHTRQRILREERMKIFGRLTNEYLVDMWSRCIELRINYIKQNLERLARQDAELMGREYIPESENVFLPSSFMGSRHWTSEQVADALAIAAQMGKPTFFVTMTCNPMWPEIQSQLLPGQSYSDNPGVVARVFKAKLYDLLKVNF